MSLTLPGHLPRRLSRLTRDTPAELPRSRDAGRPAPSGTSAPVRRVRDEVRDGIAVLAFSAAASTAVALALLLLIGLAA